MGRLYQEYRMKTEHILLISVFFSPDSAAGKIDFKARERINDWLPPHFRILFGNPNLSGAISMAG